MKKLKTKTEKFYKNGYDDLNNLDDIFNEGSSGGFGVMSSSIDVIEKVTTSTEFNNEMNVIVVFMYILQGDDVRVLRQMSQDSNFSSHLFNKNGCFKFILGNRLAHKFLSRISVFAKVCTTSEFYAPP